MKKRPVTAEIRRAPEGAAPRAVSPAPAHAGGGRRRALLAVALCALTACQGRSDRPDGGTTNFDPAACNRLLHKDTGVAQHTSDCSNPACGNGENPPTGGLHCGTWLPCRTHTSAQLRCQWIHNLEHGHVVLAYNCPSGCPDVVAALESLRDEVPPGGNGVRRALITPDPLLPKRVGAAVWGWSYSGDEVDVDAIRCLISRQDVAAYENLNCSP